MIFVALSEAADKGELLLWESGLCRFHKRRDGIIVIREIIVLPRDRGIGIGRAIVRQLIDLHPTSPIVARCPVAYEANKFWQAIGFRLVETVKGINLWEYRP